MSTTPMSRAATSLAVGALTQDLAAEESRLADETRRLSELPSDFRLRLGLGSCTGHWQSLDVHGLARRS